MATSPVFAVVPRVATLASNSTSAVTLLTAGANGTRVDTLIIKEPTINAANAEKVWVYVNTGASDTLIKDAILPVQPDPATAANLCNEVVMALGITLPPGGLLKVKVSGTSPVSLDFTAIGADL